MIKQTIWISIYKHLRGGRKKHEPPIKPALEHEATFVFAKPRTCQYPVFLSIPYNGDRKTCNPHSPSHML